MHKKYPALFKFYIMMATLFICGFIEIVTNSIRVMDIWMILIGLISILRPNLFYEVLVEMSIKNTGDMDPGLSFFRKTFKFVGPVGGAVFIFVGIFHIVYGYYPI